jgi:tRNA threonylcarbamoyladenosine biosynthesis protein TsaB
MEFMLIRVGWRLPELSLVAAGMGPGSFTGIRIGIATALGIAQSSRIPFAEISGLDALAHQAAFLNGRVGVVLDAHRSQVYYAEYVSGQGISKRVQKPSVMDILSLEHHLRDRHLYVMGEPDICGSVGAKDSTRHWPRYVPADLFLAASIGQVASMNKRRWRTGEFVVSEPMYIRPPDAIKKKNR